MTVSLAVLPWHLEVLGDMFPAVMSDARLSGRLRTALAADVAALLGLASPAWVRIQLLSSTAGSRRATSTALAADMQVQAADEDRDTVAETMVLRGHSSVTDSWLNETLVVYNAASAARSGEVIAAGSAVNQLASGDTTMCGAACIVICCVCVVVVIGIVAATIVVWVEQKKRRRRMKDALAEEEAAGGAVFGDGDEMFMYDVDDQFEGVGPDTGNPFANPMSPLSGAYRDEFGGRYGGEIADEPELDEESYDAAQDAMELDSVGSTADEDDDAADESAALSPPLTRRQSPTVSPRPEARAAAAQRRTCRLADDIAVDSMDETDVM
jgi:hypothetical protein